MNQPTYLLQIEALRTAHQQIVEVFRIGDFDSEALAVLTNATRLSGAVLTQVPSVIPATYWTKAKRQSHIYNRLSETVSERVTMEWEAEDFQFEAAVA